MGNCLVQQKKVMIEVVKTDEETVEHNKPVVKVHAISDAPPPSTGKKTAAAEAAAGGGGDGTGVLRIKVIISKQELEAILQKGGATVEDIMVSKLHSFNAKTNHADRSLRCQDRKKSRPVGVGWVPELESIPEGNL